MPGRCILSVTAAIHVGVFLLILFFSAAIAAPLKAVASGNATDLETLLGRLPNVKSRIIWTTGDGKKLPFDQWNPVMKSRISLFYQKLNAGEKNLGIHLPTLDKIHANSGRAYFTADQAFDVYAAHVAHVLYVEANRLVPWSIASRSATELDVLLAGEHYFSRIKPSAATDYPVGIQANRDFKETPENDALGELNGDPRVGYDFLSGKTSITNKRLIGKTELETLINLTFWMRDNVGHGELGKSNPNAATQRWFQNRLHAGAGLPYALANNGCHSASKLMVDLARSVNIPLLHVRSQETDTTDGHFFNRTHGGLMYNWGGREPRVLSHTDDIYANSDDPCFPLDEQTGKLATPERAAQIYFDQRWASPQTLMKAGFAYKLERVFPEKGFGVSSRKTYEDRYDFGVMIGYWKNKGGSKLDQIFKFAQGYAVYSKTLLMLACKHSLVPQLTSNINVWRGPYQDAELHMVRPMKDYEERTASWLNAAGGCEKFKELSEQWKNSQGRDLMK
jgi:hypothetical protein